MKPFRSPLAVLLSVLATSLLVACAGPNQTVARVAEYQAALLRTADSSVKPGSAAERAGIANFKAFFASPTEASVRQQTKKVFAPDAYFNDTLAAKQGAQAIEDYLARTAATTTVFKTTFLDMTRSGSDYYFRWQMDFSAPKLAGGEILRSVGMTHVRFDRNGLVTLHYDYWDAAGNLFEHIPVTGGGIHFIKKRL
jgi:hypothetical protein